MPDVRRGSVPTAIGPASLQRIREVRAALSETASSSVAPVAAIGAPGMYIDQPSSNTISAPTAFAAAFEMVAHLAFVRGSNNRSSVDTSSRHDPDMWLTRDRGDVFEAFVVVQDRGSVVLGDCRGE